MKPVKQMARKVAAAAVGVAALAMTASPALAADVYWVGINQHGHHQENAQDSWTWATNLAGTAGRGNDANRPTSGNDNVYFAASNVNSRTFVWGDFSEFAGTSLTFNGNTSGAGITFNPRGWGDHRWRLTGSNPVSGYQIDVQAGAGPITFNNGSTNPDNAAIAMSAAGTWNNSSTNALNINNVVRTNGNALTKAGSGAIKLLQNQNGANTSLTNGVTVTGGLLDFDKAVTIGTKVAFGIDPTSSSVAKLEAGSFNFGSSVLSINLLAEPTESFSYTLINSVTGSIADGQFGSTATATFGGDLYTFDLDYNQGGNNVVLSYVVPEPASVALIALGGLAMFRRR